LGEVFGLGAREPCLEQPGRLQPPLPRARHPGMARAATSRTLRLHRSGSSLVLPFEGDAQGVRGPARPPCPPRARGRALSASGCPLLLHELARIPARASSRASRRRANAPLLAQRHRTTRRPPMLAPSAQLSQYPAEHVREKKQQES